MFFNVPLYLLGPDNILKILNESDDNSTEKTATDINQAMIMFFIVSIFRGEDLYLIYYKIETFRPCSYSHNLYGDNVRISCVTIFEAPTPTEWGPPVYFSWWTIWLCISDSCSLLIG